MRYESVMDAGGAGAGVEPLGELEDDEYARAGKYDNISCILRARETGSGEVSSVVRDSSSVASDTPVSVDNSVAGGEVTMATSCDNWSGFSTVYSDTLCSGSPSGGAQSSQSEDGNSSVPSKFFRLVSCRKRSNGVSFAFHFLLESAFGVELDSEANSLSLGDEDGCKRVVVL